MRNALRACVAGVLAFAVVGKIVEGLDGPFDGLLVLFESCLLVWLVLGWQRRILGFVVASSAIVWLGLNTGSWWGGESECDCFGYFALPIWISLIIDLGCFVAGVHLAVSKASSDFSKFDILKWKELLGAGVIAMALSVTSFFFGSSFLGWAESIIDRPCPQGLQRLLMESEKDGDVVFVLLSHGCEVCNLYVNSVNSIAGRLTHEKRDFTFRLVTVVPKTLGLRDVGPEGLDKAAPWTGTHSVVVQPQNIRDGFPAGVIKYPCLIRVSKGRVVECLDREGLDRWLFNLERGAL